VEQPSKPDTNTTNELSTGDPYALAIERQKKNFKWMEHQAMLFLSFSNRNKLGCFKTNCHSKQTMVTAGLRKSKRDVMA